MKRARSVSLNLLYDIFQLMVELYDLHGSKEWVETARWIKYEQVRATINEML